MERRLPASHDTLSGGVFVSALSPFGEAGELIPEQITAQTRVLASIAGIRGIAINKVTRERECLSIEERITATEAVRQGLRSDQMVLVCIGKLTDQIHESVRQLRQAGADAVICFAGNCSTHEEHQEPVSRWIAIAERLDLPVIISLDQQNSNSTDIVKQLAQECRQVLGFEMGSGDDVQHYDQVYYALKSLDRPVSVLAASQSVLFHNLNTGGDGVLSCLAYLVPHEVVALYQATRDGRFYDAQAIHTKLAPLVALLRGHDPARRELIHRYIARLRGLASSATTRGQDTHLCKETITSINTVVSDLALQPLV